MEILARKLCRGASLLVGRSLFFALVALAAAPLPRAGAAPASDAREYQIKAVFLYNFALFVDWPAEAFSDPQAPLVIGILGDDPFGSSIDEAVRGEKVNNRPLEIRRFRDKDDFSNCHILFISQSEEGRLGQVLGKLKGRSILTVSDIEGFSKDGGIIRFVMENSKVRLKINLEASKQARLRISSKLLRPAEIVSMRRN
jgi:YfiR/HmsC-like